MVYIVHTVESLLDRTKRRSQMSVYDQRLICSAALHHEQELEAQEQREEEVCARFRRLADRFSKLAARPQLWDYTEELLEEIENLTNDLEG
jgi:hypothetical protein